MTHSRLFSGYEEKNNNHLQSNNHITMIKVREIMWSDVADMSDEELDLLLTNMRLLAYARYDYEQ